MRLVSFGNLYLDYYLHNNCLLGVMGGKTNANILANLSNAFETLFIGAIGDDDIGNICVKSLNDLGIKNIIKKVEGKSKAFFINDNKYSNICPYCNRSVGYHGEIIEVSDVVNNIKHDDVLILDRLSDLNIEVLKIVDNKSFLDLGYDNDILSKSLDELIEILNFRFEIINMNERVYNTIKNKFMIDGLDLYNLINSKILIITKGKRGCDIIYDGKILEKEIEEPAREIDSNGVGDAFFSVFIKEYLQAEIINEKFISNAYIKANIMARKCIKYVGARSHLIPLYKVINYKNCICENIKVD